MTLGPIEKPRKQPIQARSTATVEAILDATVQVLIAEGKDRLTTTRIAHRAGVSVGTLYQYFPNRRSLLQATLRRKLVTVTEAIEAACLEHRGERLSAIVEGVALAFFRAKMRDAASSLALYAVSSDVDGLRIAEELRLRSGAALAEALESAPERLSVPTKEAVFAIQAALSGMSRTLLETRMPVRDHATVQRNLVVMLCSYIQAVRAVDALQAVAVPRARQ
ncbi:TetR/AcrR family transcriptional regulator [Acidipila sp. EB88]|uniref:TetR/AcrR family transcriptional regulator n=1 Tax=Acidipila sp. EB88 TaxID=2305226 RepID=UPI001F2D15B6|nr:TetR/AcrR family transcriptional regulator [Acidipila sp. EB88]